MAREEVSVRSFFKLFLNYFISLTLLTTLILHSPNKNFSKSNPSPLPSVPTVFVTILENTLQKLVDFNLLEKDMTGPELFNKIRIKFSNASKKVHQI